MSYLIAIVAVVSAAAATEILWPWVAPSPTLVFFPAVMVVATYCGLGPGLIATVLSTGTVEYFFMPPYGGFKVGMADVVRLVIFVWGAVLSAAVANERRRLEVSVREAAALRELLYRELQYALERESATTRRATVRLNSGVRDALTHHVRPALTAIKAAIAAIGRGEPVASANDQRLVAIDHEADRLHRFVEGLETPETTGATAHRVAPVDVRDCIHAAITKAAPLMREHQIDIEEIGSGSMVLVDRAFAAEVLYLALENAIKCSRSGTRILISSSPQDSYLHRVEVTDEGPGIPIELRERVFEGFLQIPCPDGTTLPGSGLGLAVARQIVTSIGGGIWIESTPSGQGTCVVVVLPIAATVGA